METPEHLLEFTGGEVQALLHLVSAALVMQPDRPRVLANVMALAQTARAGTETKAVPEEYLRGLEHVYERVIEVLER